MRDLLTKHGIPATNINDAVEYLDSADYGALEAFSGEFGLVGDAYEHAKHAVAAILRGASSVDKVVWYVTKQTAPAPAKPLTIVGGPIVDNSTVMLVEVVENDVEPVKAVARRRRSSDFQRAVTAIEACGSVERSAWLAAMADIGIKKSSAVVYSWRYQNGER